MQYTGLILIGIFILVRYGVGITIVVLLIRALLKYLKKPEKPETVELKKTLGEAIREHRTRCGMTQELLAERLGVTRQAVSKWESGVTEPSTSNLIALAKLFDISPEELLRQVM